MPPRAPRHGPEEFGPNGAPLPGEPRGGAGARFDIQRMAPLDPVLDKLQRRSPGRQLNTIIESEDGRPVYRVRWMTNEGRRIDYVVDANTGQFLGER